MKENRSQPYLEELLKATKLGTSVVASVNKSKDLSVASAWIVAILAKGVVTGEAVHLLCSNNKCLPDAKMLNRALFEGLVDIGYIIDGPHDARELDAILAKEIAIDRFRHLEFEAERRNMSVEEMATKRPVFKQVLDEHHYATRSDGKLPKGIRPLSRLRTAERWPISFEKKLKHAGDIAEAFKLLDYPVRMLGNAQAHNRPISLREFIVMRKGKLGVKINTAPKGFEYAVSWLSFEATVFLLATCAKVADRLFLSPLTKRIDQSMARLKALGGTHPKTQGLI